MSLLNGPPLSEECNFWPDLNDLSQKILNLETVDKKTWQEGFTKIYLLTIGHRKDVNAHEPLLNNLKSLGENYVDNLLQDLRKLSGNETLLMKYSDYWENYKRGCSDLDNLFSQLNDYMREFATVNDVSVKKIYFKIWETKICSTLKPDILRLLGKNIERDRRSTGSMPENVVKNVLDCFLELDKISNEDEPLEFYKSVFENDFLKSTEEYFTAEVESQIALNVDCAGYVTTVANWIASEQSRARSVLHPSTLPKIEQICQKVLVENQLEFISTNMKTLVGNKNVADLRNLYHLVKASAIYENLLREFEAQAKLDMLLAVNRVDDQGVGKSALSFVENFSDVYKRYWEIINKAFQTDIRFISALDKLAVYLDILFKKKKVSSNEEMEDNYYNRSLAKRLIDGETTSTDYEQSFLAKKKEITGTDSDTRNCEQMFTDVKLSEEINAKFRAHCEGLENRDICKALHVLVCQSGSWPVSAIGSCSSVDTLEDFHPFVNQFAVYYIASYPGRKLNWVHHMSSVELSTNYLPSSYVLTTNFDQASLLLMYNDRALNRDIAVDEFRAQTGMAEEKLVRVLKGFLDEKLLTLDDATKGYLLNENFSSKRPRFAVKGVPAPKQTSTVISQTKSRFAADEAFVKPVIEKLIVQEYVARSESDRTRYVYLP